MDEHNFFKKLLPAAITLFWLAMMGILISQQVFFKNPAAAYQPFLSKDALLSDQWMGIYFNDSPVGFVHTSLEPYVITRGVTGYRIVNRTWMNFLLFRKRNKVWFNAEAIVDEGYQLKNFNFELKSGMHEVKVSGDIVKGRSIDLVIDSQGKTSRKKIAIPPHERGVVIASIISPFHSFGKLSVGSRYELKVFNPFSLELEPLEIKVAGKETIMYGGEELQVYVVRSDYRGLEQIAWVNDKGEIIKEETGLGWVLLKEDAEAATRMYKNMAKTDTELAELVSVASSVALKPDKLSFLKLAFRGIGNGFALESQRQKVTASEDDKKVIEIRKEIITTEKAQRLPIQQMEQFLHASDFVQSEDTEIQAQARKIVGREENSYEAAKKINRWVFQNVQKVPVVSLPSALDVLKTKEGDCNEHTVLFTALSRAAGIPAKVNVGLAYTNGRFYYHAWPSVYVGRWVDMDPTFGQDIADISHVKLIEGDISRQLDIVRLIGRIKLEVIDYK